MEEREVDAFFEGLPADALTRVESVLREALLLAVESMPSGKPFPLAEWIERRINDDIRISEGGTGFLEISQAEEVLGASQEEKQIHFHFQSSKYDEFFKGFPQGQFTQSEENMRDEIFDFLVRWDRPYLPNLSHLMCAQRLVTARKNLLQNVPLVEWIWRRMGAEIEISNSQAHISSEEVVLTQEGREVVKAKWIEPGEPPILQAKSKKFLPANLIISKGQGARSRRGGKRHSRDGETLAEKHQKTGTDS